MIELKVNIKTEDPHLLTLFWYFFLLPLTRFMSKMEVKINVAILREDLYSRLFRSAFLFLPSKKNIFKVINENIRLISWTL